MNLEISLDALSGNKHFANFLSAVRDMRENSIVRLHTADTNEIQQISGSIIAYDEMLQMCASSSDAALIGREPLHSTSSSLGMRALPVLKYSVHSIW